MTELYYEIIEQSQCVSLKDLAVSGKDLIDMGMKQGHQIGEVLNELLDQVLEHPEWNKKEILLDRVKGFL